MASIPAVPEGCRFSYLAEGAANIVYRISPRYPTPEPSMLESYGEGTPPPTEIDERTAEYLDTVEKLNHFDFKLLRLRKDLPTTLSVVDSHAAWTRVIKPLFSSDQIVDQSLVRLRPARVIEQLNSELHQQEPPSLEEIPTARGFLRPKKRQGIYLADDEFGLLITNMTLDLGGSEIIEFKPKWLAQSPSAPPNSVRCRQCARVARDNAFLMHKGEKLKKSFCPLDLTTPGESLRVAEILLRPEPVVANIYRFANWIRDTPLLRRLRDVQLMLDTTGVLKGTASDENLRAAMTLRDCTVFVRFPKDGNDDKIEARLGDLDLKSPEKMDYWRDTEQRLIRGGWYTGKEKFADRQPLTCQLGR